MAEAVLYSEGRLNNPVGGGPVRIANDVEIVGNLTVTRGAGAFPDGAVTTDDQFVLWNPEDFVGSAAKLGGTGDTDFPRWAFDAATPEQIHVNWTPPQDWNEFTVDIWWVNEGAGSGNVVWEFRATTLYLGSAPSAASSLLATTTVTAPAASRGGWAFTQFPAGGLAVTKGAFGEMPTYLFQLRRNASAGGDTLANDAGVYMLGLDRRHF